MSHRLHEQTETKLTGILTVDKDSHDGSRAHK